MIRAVAIESLCLDFQPPENLVEPKVQEYLQVLRSGDNVPAILVYDDGTRMLLFDGFHRVEAARRIGLTNLEAEVTPGTIEDMRREWSDYLTALKAHLAKPLEGIRSRRLSDDTSNR